MCRANYDANVADAAVKYCCQMAEYKEGDSSNGGYTLGLNVMAEKTSEAEESVTNWKVDAALFNNAKLIAGSIAAVVSAAAI